MENPQSVTQWIGRLKERDDEAADRIFARYLERLTNLARRRLGDWDRRVADEEDVALVALNSAFRGIQEGRFTQLSDRDDLWQILVMLVDRKAVDFKRRSSAQKRGYGVEIGESALMLPCTTESQDLGLDGVSAQEPTPEFVAMFAEELELRLTQLEEPGLRDIAVRKMEGFSNAEIAEQLGCVERTVERKLQVIRALWTKA